MTRKPKYWTYWILAFSLNLIPLVAQGKGGGPHADPVPAVKPAADKPVKQPVKKQPQTPQNYNKKAPVDPAAPPLTPNGEVSSTPPCDAPKMYKKGNKHVIFKGYSRVQKCEQAVWQQKNPSSRRPAPGTKAPEAKTAPDVVKYDTKDLTYAEVKVLVKDFDYVREGDNITGSVKLRGKIFADCADKLRITVEPKTDSKDESCRKNAAGYMITDTGGFEACMKSRIDSKTTCSTDPKSPNKCVFLSEVVGEKRETILRMANTPMGEIQIIRNNPDGNEDHRHKCESFPTPIEHITQSYVNECKAIEEQKAFERQLETAQRQVKGCTRTTEELAIAKSACEWLAHIGHYATAEECSKNLDKKEIEILKNMADRGPVDGLEEVTSSIIIWANSHPAECGKAVDVLRVIAERHVKRRVSRGSSDMEVTPFDGFNAAIETLERAADEAPCLSDDNKFIAMQANLKANRTLKVCQIGGICTQECMSQYHEVLHAAYLNYTDTCSSGGWQMDTACSAAATNFQKALTIPQKAQAELMRQAQGTQQLVAMAMQPQGGGQYGGGQYGGGQYAGTGTQPFQVPGPGGAPGMNPMAGPSGAPSFMMPGSPSLGIGSTRPGGGNGGFGFGVL